MLDLENCTLEEIEKEMEDLDDIWSLYSCDCLGFYIIALGKKRYELLKSN